MIFALRLASGAVNAAAAFGLPLLLGAPWPVALGLGLSCFALAWGLCSRTPTADPAPPAALAAAQKIAAAMGAPPPVFVRRLSGWGAGAVPRGAGYALALGDDVAPRHLDAVLAHEIAHFLTGDLHWEPFTDGPGRLLAPAARALPPLWVIVWPFLVFAAPLARATELRADRIAARAVPAYTEILAQISAKIGDRGSLFYPAAAARLQSARDSIGET